MTRLPLSPRRSVPPALAIAALWLATASAPLPAQQTKFGGKFESLEPAQQKLVRLWAAEASKIFQRPADPATLYGKLPLSTRTTFEAVTHALSRSQLTSGSGKPYGTALDLVELVERVAGEVRGERGDAQYRVYVYLKPGAVDRLYNSREFKRTHDNTVFHIGYPINFRQQGGVPSIQISVARTGRRADIDVDYRPSGGVKALTSGHLTSANSDVRAGDNHLRHNRRWTGFGEWWHGLMATLASPSDALELADFTPDGNPAVAKAARGPLPEMLRVYLEEWLIHQRPAELLQSVSIRAYPCVAEFSDGSRPDSRLALVRILKQLQDVNRRLGKVARLEDALTAVPYPLPESVAVSHPYSSLFSLRHVHEDVAWAIDCRIRYGLHLVESIQRPEHKLDDAYVASFRLKEKGEPGFLVLTWKREAGAWRLTSFDIKRTNLTPSPDLLTRAVRPPEAKAADPALQKAVDTFLSRWLLDQQFDEAAKFFLPEAANCDPLGAGKTDPSTASIAGFLRSASEEASKEESLTRVIAAAQAGHPDLRPLSHGSSGAYLLAEATPALLANNSCRTGAPAGKDPGAFLAFHFSHSRQESAGILGFYWKQVDGVWRIASYSLSAD
jgi:hypothetical protein